MATSSLSRMASDYGNLRELPIGLSALLVIASLFTFGGISALEFVWFGYSLTAEHAVWIGVAGYGVAFMSSQTKQFERYELPEKALILAGPASMLGWQYVPAVSDTATSMLGDPVAQQVMFVVSLVSWAVTLR